MKANTLQSRIKSLRKGKGLTLDDLASLTESTKSYMWELENKPAIRPSARKIMNIASALDTTVDYLMDGVSGPDDNEKLLLRVYRDMPSKMKPLAVDVLKCLT